MRLISLICVLFFICVQTVTSQSNLSFGFDGVVHEDTLFIGDTIHFNFWLVNQDTLSLDSAISIHCQTFDNLGVLTSAMSIGSNYNVGASLGPGDSLLVSIPEIISYQSYVLGDNIVVIWPASLPVGDVDTSVTSVYILDFTSDYTNSLSAENILHVYPNPVHNNLISINNDLSINVLVIFDSFGREVYLDYHISPGYIQLPNLVRGAYFIRFLFSDESEFVSKLIVE